VVTAVLDVEPDLSAFHTAFLIMAGCSLAAGLALLVIGKPRSPAAGAVSPQPGSAKVPTA
jgi:hypothetical protein